MRRTCKITKNFTKTKTNRHYKTIWKIPGKDYFNKKTEFKLTLLEKIENFCRNYADPSIFL